MNMGKGQFDTGWSFLGRKLPVHIKDDFDIDSSSAERFEPISGNHIYGVSAWREWCSLERAPGLIAMQWLSKVPNNINSHSTPHSMKIQPSVSETTGSGIFQREADIFLEQFVGSLLQACRAALPSGAPQ